MIAKQVLQACVAFSILLSIGLADSDAGSPDGTITVAVVSPRCVFGDTEANLKHFTELAEQAAAKGARLISFPELALVKFE
jgi:hypothetical protein